MSNLIKVLVDLAQRYTIVDTAYIVSIIEGVATVVAAVGAIIAVILTKKIATEQIEIAKKQNEISATQAGIAKQQNKIALFKERYETYQHIYYFLNSWSIALIVYSPKPSSGAELAEAYKETDRFMSRYYIDFQTGNTSLDFSNCNTKDSMVSYMRNEYHLRRIHRLFQLSSSDLEYINKIEVGFFTICSAVSLFDDGITTRLEKDVECINEFFRLVPENKLFLSTLEKQIDVYKYE